MTFGYSKEVQEEDSDKNLAKMTLPDTNSSTNGLVANSQTNLLNWHLFKGGLRLPEDL
jgi:hypothetical protein